MADGNVPPPLPWEKKAAPPPLPWEKAAPAARAVPPPLPWEKAAPVATTPPPDPEDFPPIFPLGDAPEPPRSFDYSEASPEPPTAPGPLISNPVTEGSRALLTGATQQGVTNLYGLADQLVPQAASTTYYRQLVKDYFTMSPEQRQAARNTVAKDHSGAGFAVQGMLSDIEDGTLQSPDEIDTYNVIPPDPEITPMRQRELFKQARALEDWQARTFPAGEDYQEGAGGAYRGVMTGLGQLAAQVATALGVGAVAGPVAGAGVAATSSVLSGLGETVQDVYSRENEAAALAFQRGDPGVQAGLSAPGLGDLLTAQGPAQMAGLGAPDISEPEVQRRVDTVLQERLDKARAYGVAAGATDLAPLETLLLGIPGMANAGRFARILAQGALEGGQEVVQQILQNTGVGRQVSAYLTESGLLGGTVGAIAQGIAEMFIPGKQRGGPSGLDRRTPAGIAALGNRLQPTRGGRLDPDQYDLPMELPEQVQPGGVQPSLPMELPEQQAPAPGQEQYELPLETPPAGTTPTVQPNVPGPAPSEVVPVTPAAMLAAYNAAKASEQYPIGDPRRTAAHENYYALGARFAREQQAKPPTVLPVGPTPARPAGGEPGGMPAAEAPAAPPGPPTEATQVLPTNVVEPPPAVTEPPVAPTEARTKDDTYIPPPAPPPGPPESEAAAPAPEPTVTAPRPPVVPVAEPPKPAPAPEEEELPTPKSILGPVPPKQADLTSFVAGQGGVQPTPNLRAQDANLHPGLLDSRGMTMDNMRQAMTDAGYIDEGTDANDAEQMIIDAMQRDAPKVYPKRALDQRQAADFAGRQERQSQLDQVASEIDEAITESGATVTDKERDQMIGQRFTKGVEPDEAVDFILRRRAEPEDRAVQTEEPAVPFEPGEEKGVEGKTQLFVAGTREEQFQGDQVTDRKQLYAALKAKNAARVPTKTGERRYSIRPALGGGLDLWIDKEKASHHLTQKSAIEAAVAHHGTHEGKKAPGKRQRGVVDTSLFGHEGTQTELPAAPAPEPKPEPAPEPKVEPTVPPTSALTRNQRKGAALTRGKENAARLRQADKNGVNGIMAGDQVTDQFGQPGKVIQWSTRLNGEIAADVRSDLDGLVRMRNPADLAKVEEPAPAPAPTPIPKRTYAPSGVASEVENRDELTTALDAGRAVRFWQTDDDGKNGRFRTIEIQREGGKYIIVRTENGQEKHSEPFDSEKEAVRRASDYANQLPAGAATIANRNSLIGRLMAGEDEDGGPLQERAAGPPAGNNKAVDKAGNPLTLYRGQHGPGQGLETRGTPTFVDNPETALLYAESPNNSRDMVVRPRVVSANVDIRNPVFVNKSDPFIDLSEVSAKLGPELARTMALRHKDSITGTGNWVENFSDTYGTNVKEMLDANPDGINQLYLDAFWLLDDPEFVAAAKAAGYDGAIHIGNGESATDVEYRVFDPSQVTTLSEELAADFRAGQQAPATKAERLEEQAAAPPAAAPADLTAKLREALAEIQGMLDAQTQTQAQPAPEAAPPTAPEQADMIGLWGGEEEYVAQQDAATRELATLNSRVPKGGPTKTYYDASMSVDTPLSERSAYMDAGLTVEQAAEVMAGDPEARISTLIRLFKTKFGFKDVHRAGTYGQGNALQVIDHLVDGYRAIRMMMNVLGQPETGGSLDGFITLILGRKTKKSAFLGAYNPEDQSIELVGRSNSFAHEWMHALDQWLMDAVSPGSPGFLSRWTRVQGIDPAVDLEGHFINVMNSIFFDDAKLATRVLDLQVKASKTYTNPKHAKYGQPTIEALAAQRMIDDITTGKSRLIHERSDTYRKAQHFGRGNSYWTNPAEMLARAFEAYVAYKTDQLDPEAKSNFIHKGEAAYHNTADRRLAETYPQAADQAGIFAALDRLMAEVALHTSLAGPTAAAPLDTELLDDNAFYAHGAREARNAEEKERQRTIVARLKARLMQTTSLTGWADLKQEFLESVGTRLGPAPLSLLTWGQWAIAGAKTFFQSEAAVAQMMVYRPQNKAAIRYTETLMDTVFEMSPGAGRVLGETFPEAVEASIRKYSGQVGNILAKHKMPIRVPHKPRTAKGVAARESRDRINHLMSTGKKLPETTPAEVEVAGALRRIYDEIYREATRVGMNIGYVEDTSYQPVIPNLGKVNVDQPGFVAQATKLYALVFERAVGMPSLAREVKVDEAITDLRQSTMISTLDAPAIVTLRGKLSGIDNQIARQEGALAAATDPKVIAGIQAQLKTLAAEKQDTLNQLATELQPLWAEMKANAWHDAAVKGEYTAQMDTLGPQTRHTKERVLPPEAQQIMKDYLVNDPIEAMSIYMAAMSRKIEYARRLGVQSGGDQDFEHLITRPRSPVLEEMESRGLDRNDPADRAKAIMTLTDPATANRKEMLLLEAKRAGAVPEDLRGLSEQIEIMTGRTKDSLGPYMRSLPNFIHVVGTMALLPRSMITSLAEPLTTMARTGDVGAAFEVMKHYGKEVFKSKDTTVRDMRDLATGIGLIASEAQDAMIQTTLAATPLGARSQHILASFFERIGQSGLTRIQHRAVAVGYELWLKKLLRIAQGTDPGDRAVARANLADLGIPAESIKMLDDFLHAGATRFLTTAELRTPMGQLWQVGARRFARSTVQAASKGSKPRFANHPYGQLVFGLTSFAYNFTRNIMVRTITQTNRDYALRRGVGESHRRAYLTAARDNLLYRGVFGFAGLFLGQFLVSWLREWLFNNAQFNKHWEEGDLLQWMLGIATARTGFFGAWDPVIQAIKGITYQRDITALTGGPYVNILLAAAQSAVQYANSENSPNTNTAERGFMREMLRLFVAPTVSAAISVMPGGAGATAFYMGLGMLGTSNTFNGALIDGVLGEQTPRGGGAGQF